MACFDTRAAETNAHAAEAVPLLCELCRALFAKAAAGELDIELPDGLVEWYVEHLKIDGT